jgi:hypothetical protein
LWQAVAVAGLLLLGVGGCGKRIGADCTVTGSGFQRSDDCAGWCMAHWPVRCANGESRTQARCSGSIRCAGSGCAAGQVCYQGSNSFAVCLPEDWCDAWSPEDLR